MPQRQPMGQPKLGRSPNLPEVALEGEDLEQLSPHSAGARLERALGRAGAFSNSGDPELQLPSTDLLNLSASLGIVAM
jgi:hypothetical protein